MRVFFAEGHVQTAEGETLTLVCDFYAIDIAQQLIGQNWDDIIPLLNTDRVLAVKVLYALLRRRHEGITLDEAAGVSFDRDQIAIWATVGDVIRRACNIADEEPETAAKKKPRGRSRSSVKSG